MIDVWEFLVLGLAIWRVSNMVVREDGPLDIFVRLRFKLGIDEEGTIISPSFWNGLLSCVWCFSVWLSLAWYILWFFLPSVAMMIAIPFSLSSLVILIDTRT